eukprot:CAMPEP_0170067670 /NCGR_PEP_ID=MMETSP0019_2-20121128/6928_1 /TAXON_ID=98059 /ORGANISM="Dinobryon sp., Strain UTEXLB2267" /LENGTH=262 /DNA_ID=CAMNT_0010275113 /DNA_START=1084 /DNA_END=1872 /DNA_ORIENTATION=+
MKYLDFQCGTELPLQIVIGGHDLTFFTQRYILFHTENAWNGLVNLAHYREIVLNATAVLIYSYAHFDFINYLGRTDGVFVIPMYSISLNQKIINESTILDKKLNDILYLAASSSPRRDVVFKKLLFRAESDGITVISPNLRMYNYYKIDLSDPNIKDIVSYHSKILFNIHQHEESVLEVHRINSMLSMGVCVVSEFSITDSELDADYADTVYFGVDFEEMYDIAKGLLSNTDELKKCCIQSLVKYRLLMTSTDNLLDAIFSS